MGLKEAHHFFAPVEGIRRLASVGILRCIVGVTPHRKASARETGQVNFPSIDFERVCKLPGNLKKCVVGWRKAPAGGRNEDVAHLLPEFRELKMRVLQFAATAVTVDFENQT